MPQLDFSTYIPQLFWLSVSFACLWYCVTYWLVPTFQKLFQDREARVTALIQKAQAKEEMAEKLLKETEEEFEHIRADSQRKIQSEILRNQEIFEQAKKTIVVEYAEKITSLQKTVKEEKETLQKELYQQIDMLTTFTQKKIEKNSERAGSSHLSTTGKAAHVFN